MRNSKLILAIGLIEGAMCLVGCAGKSRYPHYYVLAVPAPTISPAHAMPVLGSVAVREFTAPAFLRQGSIAYRPSSEQVAFYNYHRWAEDPRRVVTAAVVQDLRARGIFRSVDLLDGHGSPSCLITGSLDHLEEIDSGTVVSIEVSVSASLVDLATGEVLWRDASSHTASLDKRSVPSVVAEMSRELGTTVAELVSSMQNHVVRASSSSTVFREF